VFSGNVSGLCPGTLLGELTALPRLQAGLRGKGKRRRKDKGEEEEIGEG